MNFMKHCSFNDEQNPSNVFGECAAGTIASAAAAAATTNNYYMQIACTHPPSNSRSTVHFVVAVK